MLPPIRDHSRPDQLHRLVRGIESSLKQAIYLGENMSKGGGKGGNGKSGGKGGAKGGKSSGGSGKSSRSGRESTRKSTTNKPKPGTEGTGPKQGS